MTSRKNFLAATAALAALPAVAQAQTEASSPSPSPPAPAKHASGSFDLAAFDGLLDRDVPHKHLFAAKSISEGDVFGNMRSTINAYKSIGTNASELALAAVLYHEAMVLGLNDRIWKNYLLPMIAKHRSSAPAGLLKIVDSKTHGNPCMVRQGGEYDSSIPALISIAQPRFFVCNNALTGYAHALANMLKKKPDAVRNEWAANLVPNATLVPAGVWAVHAIQERKYTLLQSSL